jgi:hypothetical protein
MELAGTEKMPENIAQAFRFFCSSQDTHNDFLIASLLEIVEAFHRSRVDILPFKGPVLSAQGYESQGLRQYGDLDILIRPEALDCAAEILRPLGYTREKWNRPCLATASWRFNGQDLFVHEKTWLIIEPHHSFTPRSFPVDLDYDGIRKRAIRLPLEGRGDIPAPCPEDHLIITCVHGCKERWEKLQQVSDVDGLIRHQPLLDWDLVLNSSKTRNFTRILSTGLCLASRMLGTPLPSVIRREIERDSSARQLAETTAVRMERAGKNRGDVFRLNHYHMRLYDTLRTKGRYLGRVLTTPSDKHFRMLSLPLELHWLYPFVKVVHDHVMLPIWSGWKRVRKVIFQLV